MAQLGNQNAVGNNGGRPQEYDRIKIGHDFVKWATDNPDCLTVPMFATSIGLHSGILRNWCVDSQEFRALYNQAKEIIGINRIKSSQAGLLDNGIYRAHVGNYDTDINEYMREEKKFDSSLRKEEEGAKQSTYIIQAANGLTAGANIPTAQVSGKGNTSPQ